MAETDIVSDDPEADVPAKKTVTRKSGAKKSGAKKTSTKKTSAKKSSAKKSSAKKSSAKATSTKATSTKKPSTKKTSAKAASTKAASTKATSTKAASAKKTSAKKTSTKKTSAKASSTSSGVPAAREFVVTRTEVSAKVAAAELARAIDRAAFTLVTEAREHAFREANEDQEQNDAEDVGVKTPESAEKASKTPSTGDSVGSVEKAETDTRSKTEKRSRKKSQAQRAAQEDATEGADKARPAPARPTVRKRRASVSLATYDEPLQSLVERGREVLGIENLRPGQEPALTHVLEKRDVLAVMPTGSGKSLLYQLPSLILPGLTVVVSPLIALIKDQIEKMEERGVPVCRFDSTLTVRQERATTERLLAPGGKLVLTTPERMATPAFRELVSAGAGGAGVSLFVVDEAHCVSQWGHDFRPAYLTLRRALEEVGRPPVLATTATAPPHVREDILHQLGMEDAAVVTTTFDRPNLHFEVIALPGDDEKFKTLLTLLRVLPRPGVVYCATVKKVEELHEKLARYEIPVARYHGRLTKKERDTEQERFMAAKDLIMIATNAFGLGVDKTNIRYVLHYHVPGSLEAYAQEAGRGGRDNKPARCVLLFSPDDVAIQEYFLKGTYPSRRQVRAVYKSLKAWSEHDESPPTIPNLALGSRVGTQRTRTVLSLLKDEGYVIERDDHTWWLADPRPDEDELKEKAKQYEARRIADRQRLHALLDYVRAPGCRNQVILGYLGEDRTPTCGRCDNCLRSREEAQRVADEARSLERSVTDVMDSEDQSEAIPKPKRVIRHRVIRIDEPADEEAAGAAREGSEEAGPAAKPEAKPEAKPAAKPAAKPEARKEAKSEAKKEARTTAARAPSSARATAGKSTVARDAPAAPGRDARTTKTAGDAAQSASDGAARGAAGTPAGTTAKAADSRARARRSAQMALPLDSSSADATGVELTGDELTGDEVAEAREPSPQELSAAATRADAVALGAQEDGSLSDEYRSEEGLARDDGEYAHGDEAYADDDEYYDDADEYEDEDEDEYGEDEDDDGEYEDEDDEYEDDEYEDEDEEYEDDEYYDDYEDDEDDDDFEIDKTAAALAEEGYEPSDTEITILARKRVPKTRRGKKEAAASTTEVRKSKRRRRRRRKKRSSLPPKSAFTSPVLSQPSGASENSGYRSRRSSYRAGPVIEYVRGPMRINMTPVASATPNDVAPTRKKKRRRRRAGEEPAPGSAEAMDAVVMEERPGRRRRRKRRRRRSQNRLANMAEGPVTVFAMPNGSRPPPPPASSAQNTSKRAESAGEEGGGKKRRRRRRRRGRGGRGKNRTANGNKSNEQTESNKE